MALPSGDFDLPPTGDHPPHTGDVLGTICDILADIGQVTVALADPDRIGHRCGVADRERGVVLLNAAHGFGKRRATLLHELLHLACPDCDDDEVEQATAAALVPTREATAVVLGTADVEQVAARVDVDPQLVRARIAALVAAQGRSAG